MFFQTASVYIRRITTDRKKAAFTSLCQLTDFGRSQLTSTLTITKCLLSSAISWDLANTGFNAAREITSGLARLAKSVLCSMICGLRKP